MPLRQRLSLVAASAVAIAIVLAAGICYLVVRDQLRGQIDSALNAQAAAAQTENVLRAVSQLPGIPASAGGPAPYVQFVGASGAVLGIEGGLTLPVTATTEAIAAGRSGPQLSDVYVGGAHLRMITFGVPVLAEGQPLAVELARPLGPTDHVLSRLRLMLLLLCAGGIALAAALGRLAARRVMAPLAEVAGTAEHITETEDLTSRLHVHADDEVGQLATRFNAMIERLQHSRAELDESVRAQRQLVADASHELRTPVTSLRTNVEVLLAGGELAPEARDQMLADVVGQTEELSALVNDLIEVARGDLPLSAVDEVRLDRVVEEAVARARRNAPGIAFEARLAPVVITGVGERLSRAVGNLLDNAARHSPPGGTVEVDLDTAGVRVRDHGTGIDAADLPYVFDRFFRGANSRSRQGSGLGLAIVRQVVEQHGGTVSAANAPGGGALMTLRLPARPVGAAPAALEPDELRPVAAPGPELDGPL